MCMHIRVSNIWCGVFSFAGDDELQRAQGCGRLYSYPILHERLLPRLRPRV